MNEDPLPSGAIGADWLRYAQSEYDALVQEEVRDQQQREPISAATVNEIDAELGVAISRSSSATANDGYALPLRNL